MAQSKVIALTEKLTEKDQRIERLMNDQRAKILRLEQQLDLAQKNFQQQLGVKENQIKAMPMAHEMSKGRLQHADASMISSLIQ